MRTSGVRRAIFRLPCHKAVCSAPLRRLFLLLSGDYCVRVALLGRLLQKFSAFSGSLVVIIEAYARSLLCMMIEGLCRCRDYIVPAFLLANVRRISIVCRKKVKVCLTGIKYNAFCDLDKVFPQMCVGRGGEYVFYRPL